MRLIDADALAFTHDYVTADGEPCITKAVMDNATTVDAVPVVRCRDCRYFAGEFMYCAFNILVPFDYFFCLHGREEADDETD